MEIIINILAIYALSYFIRNLSGPYNLFSLFRNKLMTFPLVGVFFYKLLDCPWCLGFHSGYMVYILESGADFKIKYLILWGLVGSSVVAIIDSIMEYLNKNIV